MTEFNSIEQEKRDAAERVFATAEALATIILTQQERLRPYGTLPQKKIRRVPFPDPRHDAA